MYHKNKDYFNTLSNNVCYWAGFIAADGCLNIDRGRKRLSIQLTAEDKPHLIRFKDDVEYDGIVRHETRKLLYKGEIRTYEKAVLFINGVDEWFEDLNRHFNITPQKSLTLSPPNIALNEHRLAFIKGYSDGDGSVGIYNNLLRWKLLGTKEFLEWVKNEVRNIIDEDNSIAKTQSKIHSYRVSGQKAVSWLRHLKQIETPQLQRKWDLIP